MADLIEKISLKIPGLEVTAGLGGRFDDLGLARKSYIEAKKVLRFAEYKTASRPVFAYEQLGVYKLLFEIEPNKLNEYHREVMEPLLNYDLEQKTDLASTLFIYFEENGNAAKTAKRLFVHRNTMDYRLKKIAEVTGKNLEDSYERLALQLGVIIGKQMVNEKMDEDII